MAIVRKLHFAIAAAMTLAFSHASAGAPAVKGPPPGAAPKTSVTAPKAPGASSPGANAPLPLLPAACSADLTQALADVDKARAHLAEALKNEKAPANAVAALDKADLSALYAACCFEAAVAVGVNAGASGSGAGYGLLEACNSRLIASSAKTKQPPRSYGVADGALLCSQHATTAAEAARLAAAVQTPTGVKAAAAELRAASEKLSAQLRACAASSTPATPTGPSSAAPPALKSLGENCTAPLECQSGACVEGTCRVVAVAPNGSCDEQHLCGPLLECRDAQCRLPCACMSPCFLEGGSCKKHSLATRTVRKDCAAAMLPQGKCVLGCYAVGSVCKTDTTETYDQKPMCSLACP